MRVDSDTNGCAGCSVSQAALCSLLGSHMVVTQLQRVHALRNCVASRVPDRSSRVTYAPTLYT